MPVTIEIFHDRKMEEFHSKSSTQSNLCDQWSQIVADDNRGYHLTLSPMLLESFMQLSQQPLEEVKDKVTLIEGMGRFYKHDSVRESVGACGETEFVGLAF